MPTTDSVKAKGRRSKGTFASLPHSIFRPSGDRNAPTASLSNAAQLLLVHLNLQYNGRNNGNLSAAPRTLAPYGWKSRGSVNDAVVELVALGFLEQTRQGGRNRCSLYALTWMGIDDGPHDVKPNPVPSNLWKAENAHRRDDGFVRRWQQRRERRRGEVASRHADKPSRKADKSATDEAL